MTVDVVSRIDGLRFGVNDFLISIYAFFAVGVKRYKEAFVAKGVRGRVVLVGKDFNKVIQESREKEDNESDEQFRSEGFKGGSGFRGRAFHQDVKSRFNTESDQQNRSKDFDNVDNDASEVPSLNGSQAEVTIEFRIK